ncbi:MAG: rhomboid family intramembrane serine protease [Candidatus Brockarchaeota archaeon]|nr:rhomboid family intramembrane serine protease [Candidatus Brockarchaeota archaeon]
MWNRIERVLNLMLNFKTVFIANLFLIIFGLVVLCLTTSLPLMMDYLAASAKTPWGILTSLLVHKDWLHFSWNMISLTICSFLFAMTNMHLEEQEKHKRSLFFLWNIFFSATLANILWVIICPQVKSIGSSGVVYASIGIVMGFSLANIYPHPWNILKENLKKRMSLKIFLKKSFPIIYNLLVFLLLLFYIIIDPKGFLSVGPRVNTITHCIGFLASFLMVTALHLYEHNKLMLLERCLNCWVMLKFSCFNCNHRMPKKETAEDLVTRETWLLYYLWREKGFRGSISALSKKLGYKDDSTLNKRINKLKESGYVKEESVGTEPVFKITNKAERKILFLILPRYVLYFTLALTFADIFWGLFGLFGIFHVEPWNMLLVGFISTCAIAFLIWSYRKSEEELLKIGRPESS